MKAHSAIALFSGGLDSILAVKWMQKLGYRVFPVFFSAPYLTADKARYYAKANNLELMVRDITPEHLQMIKEPRYGFGKNYNPCIDCHALMFRIAGSMLNDLGASFLISGEVLGQRPMSQRRDALFSVAKTSGFKELLIRPLSQKLLPDTRPILEGWVNREELLALEGRGRNAQMSLAKELSIVEYPSPGGGCLLTDVNFSLRLRELIRHGEDNQYNIELLRWGRHFRLSPDAKLIVGRHEADNNGLSEAAGDAIKLQIRDIRGPLGILIADSPSQQLLHLAASITLAYSRKASEPSWVTIQLDNQASQSILVHKCPPQTLNQYMIAIEQEK